MKAVYNHLNEVKPAYPVATLLETGEGRCPFDPYPCGGFLGSRKRSVFMIKRNKFVHVKVSDIEREAWQKIAESNGVTLADLIRQRLGEAEEVGREPKRRKRLTKSADPELIRHLARVGNNLNQIAGWVNTHKKTAEAVSVIAHLITIQRSMMAFLPPDKNAD